jgi:hypothetical protein
LSFSSLYLSTSRIQIYFQNKGWLNFIYPRKHKERICKKSTKLEQRIMSMQAAAAVSRGALIWGASAGLGTLVIFGNGDVSSFFRGMSKHAMHLLSAPRDGSPSGGDSQGMDSSSTSALADQLARLSAEVSYLRVHRGGDYHGGGGGVSGSTVLIVSMAGGALGVVMYLKGWTLGDLMYVTKRNFNETVEQLQGRVEIVKEAVDAARKDLAVRIGLVDAKIDKTRYSLEQKIEQEVGDVKTEVRDVHESVKGIAAVQGKVQSVVHGLEDRFFSMEETLEDARSQLSVANRGINLLCTVVAESIVPGSHHALGNGGESTHARLMDFTQQLSVDDANKGSSAGLRMLVGGHELRRTHSLGPAADDFGGKSVFGVARGMNVRNFGNINGSGSSSVKTLSERLSSLAFATTSAST